MRLHTQTAAEFGPSSPAIELENIESLREEGEVSPLILDMYAGFNYLRGFVGRLRRPLPPGNKKPVPKKSQRNAALSL